jgi:hypothetical protein
MRIASTSLERESGKRREAVENASGEKNSRHDSPGSTLRANTPAITSQPATLTVRVS